MELKRETYLSEILDPRLGFAPARTPVEVRWDPLLGYSARLVRSLTPLLPPFSGDLQPLAASTRAACPFCPERVMSATPRLLPAVHPAGRISRGAALLFPNLLTYAKHSSVSIYAAERHSLPLEGMTARLMADNLAAQVEWVRLMADHDPSAPWASVNANHLPPSGSSLFHPHLQGSVDPSPSTLQAQFAEVSRERLEEYAATERRLGERFIADTGRVFWLASFAPIGFHEVRALIPGHLSPGELDDALVEELGAGIAALVNLYAEMGQQSFNMALLGAPRDGRDTMLTLRMVCRANPTAVYRSDVMYSERLHWQAMVDTSPEELAERARARFAR
jgi:UDPglucose--hexose-1-phosphate uridylyltransferase